MTAMIRQVGGDGRSAYQVALDNGFEGTEAAWLASLEGTEGPEAWGEPGDWLTATAYTDEAPRSIVMIGGSTYVCIEAHTSGVFATDLAAGKWKIVAAGSEAPTIDWGDINGTLSNQTDLQGALDAKQPSSANLAAFAGLSLIADRLPYANGTGTLALATLTTAGRAILDDADATAQRATLGVAIGTNVQAYSANLAAFAGLSLIADRLPYANGTGTLALATLTAAGRAILDDADATAQRATLGLVIGTNVQAYDADLAAIAALTPTTRQVLQYVGSAWTAQFPTESLIVAVGDETTAITTGAGKVTFRMPYAFKLTAVRASLTTASSSGAPAFDVNRNGTSIFSTPLTIDQSEKTSTTAATAAVLSTTDLSDDDEITIDIDTAGTGAAGPKLYFIGYRTA